MTTTTASTKPLAQSTAGASEQTDFALEAEVPLAVPVDSVPVVGDVYSPTDSLGDTAGPPDLGGGEAEDDDEVEEPALEGGNDDGASALDSPADTPRSPSPLPSPSSPLSPSPPPSPAATITTTTIITNIEVVAALEGGEDGASALESSADTPAPRCTDVDIDDAVRRDSPLEGSNVVTEQFLPVVCYRGCEDAADTSDSDEDTASDDGMVGVGGANGLSEYEVSLSPDLEFALRMDSLAGAFRALSVYDSGRPEEHEDNRDVDQETQMVTTEEPMD